MKKITENQKTLNNVVTEMLRVSESTYLPVQMRMEITADKDNSDYEERYTKIEISLQTYLKSKWGEAGTSLHIVKTESTIIQEDDYYDSKTLWDIRFSRQLGSKDFTLQDMSMKEFKLIKQAMEDLKQGDLEFLAEPIKAKIAELLD